jgi:DNA polymerase-2
VRNAVTVTGWLFDVYPSAAGVTLWLIDAEGGKHMCHRRFAPSFFLHLNASDRRRAAVLARQAPSPLTFAAAVRRELYSDDEWEVLEVRVHDTMRWREVVWYYERFFPHFAFFDSDLTVPQLFLYETDLFPLAYGDYRTAADGELLEWTLRDSREMFEYTVPPLTVMALRNANDFLPPKYRRVPQLALTYEGTTYALEGETPKEVIESFSGHLYRYDPDILVTEYGDATLLPMLTQLARRYDVPLLLNRDAGAGYITSRESSYFQYGKVVHRDGAFELAGRWHIDVENSFAVAESELEGLFELARLTQIPGQHQSRATIGTGLSSLQLSWARRHGYLIPSKKREPEEFKPASVLLLADRGGLIFQPPAGYHDEVAELDFVSMYPSIMVNHNVSPETINCRCCHEPGVPLVPELGYRICRRREGIVSATLKNIVARRAYFKQQRKKYKGKDPKLFEQYDRRQNALKWMLVTCFGYLGYKNARFGRIEAHEAVNAFSRDAILTAKEIAEAHGFRLLHAIIDCVWIRKEGATEAEYEALCREIRARVGIDISLEGIYRWLLFPASKMDPRMATANRYLGWYRHGELKVRGVELRRRDTPKFIKALQQAMVDRMSLERSPAGIEEAVPDLLTIAGEYLDTLRGGHARPMDLVIRRNISQEAGDYTNNSVSATVAKAIEEAGVHLAAGERIEYILVGGEKEKARPLALYAFEDGYDIEKYTELVLKAVETILLPWGYDYEKLRRWYRIEGKHPRRSERREKAARKERPEAGNEELPFTTTKAER